MSHIESISNGLGAQSLWLVVLACRKEIPARLSITADTGWEKDRLWNTGRRSSSEEYFREVVLPLCADNGIEALFVRAKDKFGKELPGLLEHTKSCAESGNFNSLKIPLFGSDGGRLSQPCTGKMKIRAINQTLRLRGATTARTAQGIHYGEATRRVNGKFIGMDGQWSIWQTTLRRNGVEVPIRWLTHYYPLVDLKLRREHIVKKIDAEGIPYLISSECDGCPHQDLPRWERHLPSVLNDLAEVEKQFNGEFFFTDQRIPLLEALENMKRKRQENPDLFGEADFGCRNDHCGV